jgi:transcriptional regulator with XRE-family HTH domain
MKNAPSPAHIRALQRLGSNISLARRRRRWTQRELAEQIGASESTVRRMEAGDPGIALQHLLGAMAAFGAIDQFCGLLDTRGDSIGLVIQDRELPQRVRKSSSRKALA